MGRTRTERTIQILENLAPGELPDCAVVKYRRKKWPRKDREEGFWFLRSDGEDARGAAIVRAEFFARVQLPKRYADAFDVRIVLERRRS